MSVSYFPPDGIISRLQGNLLNNSSRPALIRCDPLCKGASDISVYLVTEWCYVDVRQTIGDLDAEPELRTETKLNQECRIDMATLLATSVCRRPAQKDTELKLFEATERLTWIRFIEFLNSQRLTQG